MALDSVAVSGPPPTGDSAYNVRTCRLGNNSPFELSDRRWGIMLHTGAIVFSGIRGAELVTLNQLENWNEFRLCRKLPGKVEITYKV